MGDIGGVVEGFVSSWCEVLHLFPFNWCKGFVFVNDTYGLLLMRRLKTGDLDLDLQGQIRLNT